MDIFIFHDDGLENGPYSWVDIFIMLTKGELNDESLVRIGSESRSISEWNHWCERTETPPHLIERVRGAFQSKMSLRHARMVAATVFLLVFIGGVHSEDQQPKVEKSAEVAKVAPSPTQRANPQNTITTSLRGFFEIRSVELLKKQPEDEIGVWHFAEDAFNRIVPDTFQPCLKVQVLTNENIRSDKLTAKAYFFGQNNKMIASSLEPSKVGSKSEWIHNGMQSVFHKKQPSNIFFEIPEKIKDKKWKAVVVFGDRDEAQSACYPNSSSDFLLSYPEKELVHDRSVNRVVRKPAMDPLIEHVVKTKNPHMPQITFFLRLPNGVTDPGEIRGVMAVCMLAVNVDSMRRELQKEEMEDDYYGIFTFANKEKLAILAWGSRTLWEPDMNYDDLTKEQSKKIDESFDLAAEGWEQGVKELCSKYGIPDHNFLLWGVCGSAQWAHRLCLRKPEYFLSISIHLSGSFDHPTPEASKVLWCITTGELYGGYERSKRFVTDCRKLGYPIMFKAIVGIGHDVHPDVPALNFEFMKFALTQKGAREEYDKLTTGRSSNISGPVGQPWPEAFRKPPFFGDMVNQEMYPADQMQMIPEGFRISIPNKELADIWARSK